MNRLSTASLLACVLAMGGCGVELAVIGAAASAASSAASAGSAVYKRGKLDAAWNAPFDLVLAAAEIAASELGLLIVASEGDDAQWTLRCETFDGDEVVIRVIAETKALTRFQIDVGWFGSEPVARLTLKRMALAINLNDDTGDVQPATPPTPTPPQLETDETPRDPDPLTLVPEAVR